MRNRISLLSLIVLAGFTAVGCDGTNLFDQLYENSLSVTVKGTFESNDPRLWDTTAVINDDSIVYVNPDQVAANKYNRNRDLNSAITAEDSTASVSSQYQQLPSAFMLDIAEIRMDGDTFANYREVYTCPTTDAEPFFSGAGRSYSSDDVQKDKSYSNVEVYIRKMTFDNAFQFNITGGDITGTAADDASAASAYIKQNQVLFDEKKQTGFDFNIDFVWAFYDILLKSQYYINRSFPLNIPISGGFATDDKRKSVVEVRFVVKDFVKRFENLKTMDDGSGTAIVCHFFALSDWMRDVRPYRATTMGGNLMASARTYFLDSIGTISGQVSGAAASSVVMAIPDDDVTNLSSYYEYSTRPDIADDYATVSPSCYATSVGFGYLDYALENQRHCAEFVTYYQHLKDELLLTPVAGTPYESKWTSYNSAQEQFRVPPLATCTDSSGKFVLKNVPVGKGFTLYISTQSSNPASASGAKPAPGTLPYGWKLIGTATVSSANTDKPMTAAP